MKIIFSIFIVLVLLIAGLFALVFCAKRGYLDSQLERALVLYLESKGVNVKLQGFTVKGNEIKLTQVQIPLIENAKAEINDLDLEFTFGNLLTSSQLNLHAKDTEILIKNNQGQVVTKALLKASYQVNFINGTIDAATSLENIDDLSNHNSGKGYCNYKKGFFNEQNIDCELYLNDTSNTKIDSQIKGDDIKFTGIFNNIPLSIYKPLEKILAPSKLFKFLDDFIKDGYIKSGEINVDIDKNYYKTNILTPENLSGNFEVFDLEFKYGKDFPPLKNVEIDVNISGTKTEIALKKAYSGGSTIITDGEINFDLTDLGKTVVVANASAKGVAADLIDFIPEQSLEKLKKVDIDLRKFTGTANTKIHLSIPLAPETPNSYNITSEISGVGLRIFNDNLELKGAKISGGFDGSRVFLNGVGKINDFESDLSYCFNLKEPKDYDHLLKIKTKIKTQNQKFGLIKVLDGSGLFDFEYRVVGDKSTVDARADLKKTQFYINKLAIHKKKGEKADLAIHGDFNNYPNINLDFKLAGDNGLKIIGDLHAKDGGYELSFPFINHKNTNVRGKISFGKDNFSANIEGPKLDLSEANMMQFLQKDKESTNSELKVKVEKIMLKNNIYLDNFFLTIKCNKSRCYKGYIDSKIGSKYFKMLLKTFADNEEWIITSTNAGALFKGLGLYDNMKTGAMLVILNTKRQEVKTGEIIPILDGTFTFRNFVIVDTPFLTRLVSFISLPGLKNLVTNNKDVIFKNMNGKFNYNNDVINITESAAEGPFFDFTLEGRVDAATRKIGIKGDVIPSMYGLSTILKNIPILGTAFSGGHRKGLIFAPYSLHQSY